MAAYVFQFELSLIPVQCYFKVNDAAGIMGLKASFISLTFAFGFYLLVLILLLVQQKVFSDDIYVKNCSFFLVIYRHFGASASITLQVLIIVTSVN